MAHFNMIYKVYIHNNPIDAVKCLLSEPIRPILQREDNTEYHC